MEAKRPDIKQLQSRHKVRRVPVPVREPVKFCIAVTRLIADRLTPVPPSATRPRGLALIHKGRCGSTVLGSMLDQNPGIYWDGEALRHHGSAERWLRRLQGARGHCKLSDLQALMRYARGRTYVLSAEGKFGYPSTRYLVDDLLRAGFDRFAILQRRNSLRRVVSAEIGMQYEAWVLNRGRTPSLKQVRVPVRGKDGKPLVERLRGIDQWYAGVRQVLQGLPTLELKYEEHMLQDPMAAYREVCRFLDIEEINVRARFERVNPFPMRQLIVNYQEVESALRGTEFEWMLDGPNA